MNQTIIEKLFPATLPTLAEIEGKYPPRKLEPTQQVTRIAPSPTGLMHIGTLYTALISERIAHQSNGVFFVRIEDTDKKREVEGADEIIMHTLRDFDFMIDEYPPQSGEGKCEGKGDYGPYVQSERKDIYQACVKSLVEKDLAYPCFCTAEEIETIRKTQESLKARPGYYGTWAKWRDASEEQILEQLDKKTPFVIRFRSNGNFKVNKVKFNDLLKGNLAVPENDLDIVILKSEGLPTYHLAHVADDHFMGTTIVTRGDEWLASVPLHLQLFAAMGWQAPTYAHLAPIQKMDGSSKRKLSKRKDAEAGMGYYEEQGYPKAAVIDYLLNLANSNYEDWRKANLDKSYKEFSVAFEKMSGTSGALFDFVKLDNISKDIISRYLADEVYEKALEWADAHDASLAELLRKDPDYARKIMNIERANSTKVRKDLAKWSDVMGQIEYFYDDKFKLDSKTALELLEGLNPDDIKAIITSFLASFRPEDTQEEWFAKVKTITDENQFASDMKKYRQEPQSFKGSIVDVTKIFRVLLTGKPQSPDLYQLMAVMGKERVERRLSLL